MNRRGSIVSRGALTDDDSTGRPWETRLPRFAGWHLLELSLNGAAARAAVREFIGAG